MVANFRVNCVCGAIYDVIEASGYSKDQGLQSASCATGNYSHRTKLLVKCGSSGAPMRIESDALEERVHGCKAYRYAYRGR